MSVAIILFDREQGQGGNARQVVDSRIRLVRSLFIRRFPVIRDLDSLDALAVGIVMEAW